MPAPQHAAPHGLVRAHVTRFSQDDELPPRPLGPPPSRPVADLDLGQRRKYVLDDPATPFAPPPYPHSAVYDRTLAAAGYCGRARHRDELLAAYRLVHDCYVQKGFIAPSDDRARVSFFNLLPDTATFVLTGPEPDDPLARRHARSTHQAGDNPVLGTISVVLDSLCRLPMADCFAEWFRTFKRAGRRTAEMIMLAHKPRVPNSETRNPEPATRSDGDLRNLQRLLRCAIDYVRLCNVDDLCILTHPHHVAFYERKLTFEVVDGPRACSSVRGAPAVLLRLNMHTAAQRSAVLSPRAFRFFLNRDPDPQVLEGYRLRGPDVLELLSNNAGLRTSLMWDAARREVLAHLYPEIARALLAQGSSSRYFFPTDPLEIAAAGAVA